EAAVADVNGLAPHRLEVRQITLGQPAPRLLDGARDGLGDRSAIENLAASYCDLAEGARELLVGHHLARARPAIAQVEPLRLGRAAELRARLLDEAGVHERKRHALL